MASDTDSWYAAALVRRSEWSVISAEYRRTISQADIDHNYPLLRKRNLDSIAKYNDACVKHGHDGLKEEVT